MTIERIPEVGEIWTNKNSTSSTVKVLAFDGNEYWVLHSNSGNHYTFNTFDIVKFYNPPKAPLIEVDEGWFPLWFPLIPGHSRMVYYENEAVKLANGVFPVLRIEGVNEDGKVYGEQIR